MNHEEILTKAIEKAIAGGWNMQTEGKLWNTSLWLPKDYATNIADAAIHTHCTYEIIFNHDFGKALWGEEILTNREDKYDFLNKGVTTEDHEPTGTDYDYPMWMWHLQQMVVADDPIAYLGEWYNGFIK